METLKNYLFELCSDNAPSGREDLLSSLERLITPFSDKVYRDTSGNLIAVKYGKTSAGEKIMLDAHADEIGLVITGIDEKGFLHFANHAGVDDKILPASTVTVLGKHNLTGVIATLPPHLLKDADTEKTVKAEDMVIDVGLDKENALKYVNVGDYATLRSSCAELKNGLVMGKSFDNRVSCAVLVKLMSMLCKVPPRCDVYMTFTAGEEFGGYGAKRAAFDISPDSAVVLDTTFAVSPYTSDEKARELGKGPVFCISPILDRKMTDMLAGNAKVHGIPYQIEVTNGKTGTNCDSIVTARDGVPSALLSLPLRYMHSAGEVVSLDDMQNAVRILLSYTEYRGGVR